jgi:hypothetical protein
MNQEIGISELAKEVTRRSFELIVEDAQKVVEQLIVLRIAKRILAQCHEHDQLLPLLEAFIRLTDVESNVCKLQLPK